MTRLRTIALAGSLLLAACTDEIAVPTPPVVVAGRDIDAELAERVALVASAADSDGRVERFEWTLVVAPDGAMATVQPKSATGDVAELVPGGTSGLYVISVVAVDDQGLRSEPDFLNVLLRPPSRLALELVCEEHCTEEAGSLIAIEKGEIRVRARITRGVATSVEWSANVTRNPADPLVDAPVLVPDGDRVSVHVPPVGRAATMTVIARAHDPAGDEAVARLDVRIPDTLDEPPRVVALRVRQPGQSAELSAATVVLPGDALHVEADVADPNGDPFECVWAFEANSPTYSVAGDSSCRMTLYPLGSTLEFTVTPRSTEKPTSGEPMRREIAVGDFVLETDGQSVRGVGVDASGRVVGAGDGGVFYTWGDSAARRQFSTSIANRPQGATAAVVSQPGAMGFIGWANAGEWSRIDVATGVAGAGLRVTGPNPPGSTRGMAVGSGGRVFAATDEGLLAYDPFGGMHQWRPPLPDLRAVAIERRPSGPGRVWYATDVGVHYLGSESVTAWPSGSPGDHVTTMTGGEITALALSSSTRDLWIGTGAAGDPNETGAGLYLYAESLDANGGPPNLSAAAVHLTREKGIRSIALEESGPYAGDAWIVAGEKLFRVSRAAQLGGSRSTVPLELGVLPGGVNLRSVAVRPGGTRQVVVGTSQGLAGAPGLP